MPPIHVGTAVANRYGNLTVTVPAGADYLVGGAGYAPGGLAPDASATFNGDAMDLVAQVPISGTAFSAQVIFGRVNPDIATGAYIIAGNGAANRAAAAYQGVDPVTPTGATAVAVGTSAAPSITVATQSGSLAIAQIRFAGAGTTIAAGTGETVRVQYTEDGGGIAILEKDGTGGDVTFSPTLSQSTGWEFVATSLNGAVAPPTLDYFEITETNGDPVANFAQDTPRALRIRAVGSDGETFIGFVGTVDITSTGSLVQGGGTSPAFVLGVLASRTFEFDTPDTGIVIECADTSTGLVTGISATFDVSGPPVLTSFDITELNGSALTAFRAGTPKSVRIRALDQNGNVLASFASTVDVSTLGGTLNQGEGTTGAFTAGVLGAWPVEYDAQASGVRLRCEDTATGLVTGLSGFFDVTLPASGGGALIGGASALIN